MVDDRHSFLVVDESLPTETIAEYRRSRRTGGQGGARRIRARILARLSRPRVARRRAR
jgi:hypothetical protein